MQVGNDENELKVGLTVTGLIDEFYGYVGWKSKGGHAHGTSYTWEDGI